MRNLKRVFSLALALVMVLGMMVIGTSAATYTDAEEITYTEAVEVMSALGILKGYEAADGTFTFNPTGTLSRAEAAKILAFVCLGADADDYLTGSAAAFEDVKVTNWAAKYVAFCKNAKIADGVNAEKTLFNPAGTLTTVQFAKMLLVAAGIEGEYTGPNWAQNVKDAMVDAKLNVVTIDESDITREEACELALAAMKYSATPEVYYVMNGATKVGTFTDLLEASLYAKVLGNGYTVEPAPATDSLLYTVYGVTYLDENQADSYGRPGVRYTNAETQLNLFYADKPAMTYVNSFTKDVYDALVEAQYSFASTVIWYNGSLFETSANSGVSKAVTTLYTQTGAINGYNIEMYNTDTNPKTIEKVVVTENYLVVVGETTPAEGQTPASLTVDIYEAGYCAGNQGAPYTMTVVDNAKKTTDMFDVLAKYEEDDVVMACVKQGFNAQGNQAKGAEFILAVEDVATVSGIISKVNTANTTNATTIVIDGTTYKLNSQCVGGKLLEAGTEGTLFLDAQGYGIGWADKQTIVEKVYAYVIGMDSKTETGLFEQAVTTVYAKLLKLDGTVEVLPVTATDTDDQTAGVQNTLIGTIVTLTDGTGRDTGKTVLAKVSNWAVADKTIVNNAAKQLGAVFNNKTVFVVQTTNALTQKPVYTVYTGITNMPASTTGDITALLDNNGIVKIMYLTDATVPTAGPVATKDMAYLVANNNLVKEYIAADEEVVEYYVYKAIINGEITTVKVDAEANIDTGLYSSLTYVDGYVTAKGNMQYGTVNGVTTAGVSETGTAVAKDGVIKLGNNNYLYNDATVVYKVTPAGISVSSIGALKADQNDSVIGYTTNGMLTMIVVTVNA